MKEFAGWKDGWMKGVKEWKALKGGSKEGRRHAGGRNGRTDMRDWEERMRGRIKGRREEGEGRGGKEERKNHMKEEGKG